MYARLGYRRIIKTPACIERLPNETLMNIFDHCNVMKTEIRQDHDIYPCSVLQRNTMLAITHTCFRWRQVALSTPTLWTHIDIDPDHYYLIRYALRCVKLSKPAPIIVYFRPSAKGGDLRRSLGVAFEDASRVRKLVIHGQWVEDSYYPLDTVFSHAPNLEELIIVGLSSCREPLSSSRVDSLDFQSTPSLRHIRIGLNAPKIVTSHFSNLRTLMIDFQRSDIWDSSETFPAFLCAAPRHLEELTISRAIPVSILWARHTDRFTLGPDGAVELPFLRKFVVTGVKLDPALGGLLYSLRIADSATRQFLMEGIIHCETLQTPSLDELVLRGRMDSTSKFRSVALRKLHLVLLPQQPEYLDLRYLAVENDTITVNSNDTPWTLCNPFFDHASRIAAEVEELVIVAADPGGRMGSKTQHILPALPFVRKLTIWMSVGGYLGVLGDLVQRLCEPVGSLPPMNVLYPCLESVELLFNDPSDPKCSSVAGDDPQVEDAVGLLVRLAEERKRLGASLKEVVVEGYPAADESVLRRVFERASGVRSTSGNFEDIMRSIEACRSLSS